MTGLRSNINIYFPQVCLIFNIIRAESVIQYCKETMMVYQTNHLIGLALMGIVTALIIQSPEASYELSFPFYRSGNFGDELEEENSGKH